MYAYIELKCQEYPNPLNYSDVYGWSHLVRIIAVALTIVWKIFIQKYFVLEKVCIKNILLLILSYKNILQQNNFELAIVCVWVRHDC